MNFGNFNIKDLKLGNAQVASVWYGASKLWPLVSTVTIAATAGEHVLSITGTGTYNYGDTVSLAAEPEIDYMFDGWYENGILLSRDNPYIFTAETDITLEATAIAMPAATVILDKFVMPSTATSLIVVKMMGQRLVLPERVTATWKDTFATVPYSDATIGVYEGKQEILSETPYTAISSSFPQNLSDETVIRNATFVAIDGNTYNVVVEQAPKGAASPYKITLTGISDYGFELSPSKMPNLDIDVYDGVYLSNNKGVDNSYAVARIDFNGMPEFTVWINSYADGIYDYTVASELDATSYPTTRTEGYTGNSYKTAAGSKDGNYSNTASYQKQIDAAASAPVTKKWRKIVYANDGGDHHIYITYIKDSYGGYNDDTGAFIVEKG